MTGEDERRNHIPQESSLARCVGQVRPFLRKFWERAPFLRKGIESTAFHDLFTPEAVDFILWGIPPNWSGLRLIKEGQTVDPRNYLKRSAAEDAGANGLPDLGRIYKNLQAGATIVLSGLQRYWLPLAHFCNALELELTQPIQANAYITPRGSRGFDVHFDTHDVFLLQVTGSKHWVIYKPLRRLPLPGAATQVVKEPGPPILELNLHAGDSLYIPRGFPHGASSLDNTSIHLTVGVLSITWNQLVTGALELALDALPFRRSLPPGFALRNHASLERQLDKKLKILGSAIKGISYRAAAVRALDTFWRTRPAFMPGQLSQLSNAGRIATDTVVSRHEHSIFRLKESDDELSLIVELRDRDLHMPIRLAPVMKFILRNRELTALDLAAYLDQDSAIRLVRRLVEEGFLAVVSNGTRRPRAFTPKQRHH